LHGAGPVNERLRCDGPAEEELLDGLNEESGQALGGGESVRGQVKLTRREEEVLAV